MTLWLSCGYYPSWITLHAKEPKWDEKKMQWDSNHILSHPCLDLKGCFPKIPLPGELLEIEVKVKETWVME